MARKKLLELSTTTGKQDRIKPRRRTTNVITITHNDRLMAPVLKCLFRKQDGMMFSSCATLMKKTHALVWRRLVCSFTFFKGVVTFEKKAFFYTYTRSSG